MTKSIEKQNPGVAAGALRSALAGGGKPVIPITHRNALHGHPIDLLLPRLDGVKSAGKGYRARCPVCGGMSAKLAVAPSDTGSVLLHCFAGCVPAEIVAAVSLRMADLFPERLRCQTDAERRQAREYFRIAGWQAALETLSKEAAIVNLAAQQLLRWQALSKEDDARLKVAESRIAHALDVLRPHQSRFRPEVGHG